jgi:ADP-ribose pyrophosphatase YjhB (NUDIX family)
MTVGFRLRPSAAIVRDDAILLIEFDDPGSGLHYNLPGGGLHPEETVYEGLRRELREEACAEIEIGSMVMVWEHAPAIAGITHHIGLVFRCDLASGSEPRMPEPGDDFQTGVRWIPLAQLGAIRLLPEQMAKRLPEALQAVSEVDPFVMEHW